MLFRKPAEYSPWPPPGMWPPSDKSALHQVLAPGCYSLRTQKRAFLNKRYSRHKPSKHLDCSLVPSKRGVGAEKLDEGVGSRWRVLRHCAVHKEVTVSRNGCLPLVHPLNGHLRAGRRRVLRPAASALKPAPAKVQALQHRQRARCTCRR